MKEINLSKVTNLYLVFSLITHSCFSQSKLKVTNPSPRVGDEIEIQIQLEQNGKKYGHGTLKLSETTKVEGETSIGPFTYEFQNKTFKTDVLNINIAPRLPLESEGIWLRLIKLNELYTLIIEQRISNYWKKESSTDGKTLSLKNKIDHFELKRETVEDKGFVVVEVNSSSGPRTLKENSTMEDVVSYKILILKFKKSVPMNAKVKIDETFFLNVKKGQIKEDIWID